MRSDSPTPGLKRRLRKNGPPALYWCARADAVKAGYEPETVRLPYPDDAEHLPLISAACQRYQAEMLAWMAGYRRDPLRFDGTLGSLARRYELDPASPFNRKQKWNTQRANLHVLKSIHKALGQRSLTALKIGDFHRWYDAAKAPKTADGPERLTKAHNLIKMLRAIIRFGVTAELPECARLHAMLSEAEFAQPARRRVKLELQHVEAFVEKAIELGRISLALATAIQFETLLRQRDVIGEWEPIPAGEEPSGIVLNGKRWGKGLTWSDLSPNLELFKETTKTGQTAAADLSLCPLVLRVFGFIPAEKRVGPLIIDEATRRPYAEFRFAHAWRKVARAAGIPDEVRNMDARAGGISEAEDARASLDDIRAAAAHSLASTTARYVRGTIGKSRKVHELRAAHRAGRNKA